MSLLMGAIALALSIALTPLIRDAFLRLGLVDEPDQDRKLHTKRIPRVGGIAVFFAYVGSFAIVAFLERLSGQQALPRLASGWWLLSGTTLVFLVGLLDDLLELRPKQKLLGQISAAALVWCGSIRVHVFEGLGLHGWVSFLLTVAWLVFCSNAFNLIDGLDGLAAGAALFSTLTIIGAGLLGHNLALVAICIPLVGCLLGFLRYNSNPASVFLGDCGSLTLGFFLGCVGTLWSQKINTFFGMAAPVMALSLPLIDTSLAITRRVLRNRPLFSGDRGHIHHRLLDRGIAPRQAAWVLYGASALAAVCSLLQEVIAGQYSVVVIGVFCVLVWLGIQYLGYLEFVYVRWFLAKGTLFRLIDDQIRLAMLTKSLSGAKSEEEAFVAVKRTCHDLGFTSVVIRSHLEERALDLAQNCHVHIPLGADHILILTGLSRVNRPIALPQLTAVMRDAFETKLGPSLPSFARGGELNRYKELVATPDLYIGRQ